MPKLALACLLGFALAACSPQRAEPSAVSTSATSSSQAAGAAPAPILLGEPLTRAPPVALADLARDPRIYAGRSLATSGTVTAVCQHAGCWMEIRDESADAHVRMHGHSFFIPKSASGRHARVQATVLAPAEATECAESPSGEPAKGVARVELDATGVELD